MLEPALLLFLEEKDCAHFYFCFRWLLILFKVPAPPPPAAAAARCSPSCALSAPRLPERHDSPVSHALWEPGGRGRRAVSGS